jgi:hypothetical protein
MAVSGEAGCCRRAALVWSGMMVKRLAPFQRAMPNADGALDRVIDRRKATPFLAGVSSKSVKNSLRQVLTSTRMFFLKNGMSKQCILSIGDTVENMHFAPISSGYKSGLWEFVVL